MSTSSAAKTIRPLVLAALLVAATACIPVGEKNFASPDWQQDTPQVASDGTNALVVWRDYRNGSGNGDIYAALVAPDQTVLVADIAISNQPGTESSPDVAFDGTNFVVAWGDRRNGDADLYAARVSPGGQVLDANGVLLAGGANDQRRPALAFDGTNYLAVYEETSSQSTTGISAKRFAPDLTVVDTAPMSLATAGKEATFADVVYDGAGFYAAWGETETDFGTSDIMTRRVSSSGVAGPPIPMHDDFRDQTAVTMVFDGTNTLVMWVDRDSSTGFFRTLVGRRVATSGAFVDANPVSFEDEFYQDLYLPTSPDLSWDGTSYVLAYTVPDDFSAPAFVVRVDAAGDRVSPRRRLEATDSPYMQDKRDVALAMVGDIAFTAFTGTAFEVEDFVGAIGTSALNASDEILVGGPVTAVRPTPQTGHAIAHGADTYLQVWSDFTGVHAARFDDQLEPLDTAPIDLELSRFQSDRITATFNGTNFVIIGPDSSSWTTPRAITMSPDGTIVNSVALAGLAGAISYDIESSGSSSLVVASGLIGIRSLLLDHAGTPTTSVATTVSTTFPWAPSVAWDGAQFHIVWSDDRNGTQDVFGTRVAADGTPLDTVGTPIATTPGDERDPQIAGSGADLAVVWERTFNGESKAFAQLLQNTGAPAGSPIEFAAAPDLGSPLVVHRDGYVVTWSERNGTDHRVEAAQFDGTTVTGLGTVATTSTNPDPTITGAVPGVVALGYDDIDPDDGQAIALWRIFYS